MVVMKYIVYIALLIFNLSYVYAVDAPQQDLSSLDEIVDGIDEGIYERVDEENLSTEESDLANLSIEQKIDESYDSSLNENVVENKGKYKTIVKTKAIDKTNTDTKLGKSYTYDKNKHPFKYSKFFILAGYPTTPSFTLSNLSNDYNVPPIFVPNSNEVDLINDFGMDVLTTFFLSAEYRPFERDIFNGFRLTTSYLKQSAGMSYTTRLDKDGYPVGINIDKGESFLTDYFAVYDLNSYRFIINYDFFILKNSDIFVPYIGFGGSIDDINFDSSSNYKKKTCDPQEVLPPIDGTTPPVSDGCKAVKGDTYSLSKNNLVLNSVFKVGINLFNGYFFIEHSWIKGKSTDYNSTMQETSFAIRIPLN
jgi:hypothetical protein